MQSRSRDAPSHTLSQRTSLTDVIASPAAHSHRAFCIATTQSVRLVQKFMVKIECQYDSSVIEAIERTGVYHSAELCRSSVQDGVDSDNGHAVTQPSIGKAGRQSSRATTRCRRHAEGGRQAHQR